MVAEHDFELPNGFVYKDKLVEFGVARELGTSDMSFLRDRKAIRQVLESKWTPMDVIVRRNIVQLGDVTDPAEIETMYNDYLHLADSIFLLIETRKVGVNDRYAFDFKCKGCETLLRPTVTLSKLPIDKQPKEFQGKEEFTLPVINSLDEEIGMVIKFAPILAQDSERLRTIITDFESERPIQEALVQLKEINGEPVTNARVKALSWRELNAISYTMETVSGGIDIRLEHKCPKKGCNLLNSFPMPLGPDFLLPGKLYGLKSGEAVSYRLNGDGEKN